jgi:potassium-dependent mechanosensitive channel
MQTYKNVKIILTFVLFSVFAFSSQSAFTQNTKSKKQLIPTVQAGPEISASILENRKKKVEDSKTLDNELKTKILELYDQAIQQIQLSEEWTAKGLSFEKATKDAPAFLESLQKELAKPIVDATPEIDSKWTLTQVEPLLNKAESDLAEAQKNLADLRKEESDRTNRRTDIPNQIAKNQDLLKDINTRLANPLSKEGNAELSQTEKFLLLVQRKALEQEINSSEKELLSYNARGTLLLVRIDLASQRLSQQEKIATAWRSIASSMRQKQADDDALKARKETLEASREHPLLKSLAEYNSKLADKRTGAQGLATAQKKAADDLNQIKKLLETTQNSYEDIQTRLKTAGITHGIGVLLRKQRTEIPDLRMHQGNIRSRQSDISDAQLEWFDYKGQRSNLADIESVVQASLATLTDATEAVRNELMPRIKTILNTRKNYLQSLINDYDDYINTLINLDIAERNLIEQASELKEYIDKHILWIRSTIVPGLSDTGDFIKALSWVCDYQGWRIVFVSLWDDYNQNFSAYFFCFILYILLIYGRLKWAPRIYGLSDRVKKKKLLTTFSYTVESLFFTLFIAVFLPLILAFFAWRLSFYVGVSEYPLSVTSGLYTTAYIFYTLELLRCLCKSKGLGEVHFKWSVEKLTYIRRNLIWFAPLFLVIAYTFSIIEWQSIQEHKDTLGRLLFISGMVVISVFNRKSMTGFANIPTNQTNGWSFKSLNQRHYLWYPIALYLPIILALLAFIGYYYTAIQLNWRFISTVWLAFGLIICLFKKICG